MISDNIAGNLMVQLIYLPVILKLSVSDLVLVYVVDQSR